jgi:hypothetical protein
MANYAPNIQYATSATPLEIFSTRPGFAEGFISWQSDQYNTYCVVGDLSVNPAGTVVAWRDGAQLLTYYAGPLTNDQRRYSESAITSGTLSLNGAPVYGSVSALGVRSDDLYQLRQLDIGFHLLFFLVLTVVLLKTVFKLVFGRRL